MKSEGLEKELELERKRATEAAQQRKMLEEDAVELRAGGLHCEEIGDGGGDGVAFFVVLVLCCCLLFLVSLLLLLLFLFLFIYTRNAFCSTFGHDGASKCTTAHLTNRLPFPFRVRAELGAQMKRSAALEQSLRGDSKKQKMRGRDLDRLQLDNQRLAATNMKLTQSNDQLTKEVRGSQGHSQPMPPCSTARM